MRVTASDAIELVGTSADGQFGSGLFVSNIGSGDAGNLSIDAGRLVVRDGAAISSASLNEGTAGNINITVRTVLQAVNGVIRSRATGAAGGAITINARTIRLFGNSDIRSDIASGADNGGAITLTADSILALDDSDILAFAREGRGGDIRINTPAFFGQNYRPSTANPDSLNNNNRVDVNATGAVSGIVTIPDVSFIQNSLTELPDNQINTDTLLASSCIARRNQATQGSFTITETGNLPQRPGDVQTSNWVYRVSYAKG